MIVCCVRSWLIACISLYLRRGRHRNGHLLAPPPSLISPSIVHRPPPEPELEFLAGVGKPFSGPPAFIESSLGTLLFLFAWPPMAGLRLGRRRTLN